MDEKLPQRTCCLFHSIGRSGLGDEESRPRHDQILEKAADQVYRHRTQFAGLYSGGIDTSERLHEL